MRLFFAIAAFAFALYLLPGMWGAPLKALSGWIPPDYTQDFKLGDYQPVNSNQPKQKMPHWHRKNLQIN